MEWRHRYPAALIMVGCALPLIGCSGLWNRVNQRRLEHDIFMLLNGVGVYDPQPECKMVGSTRNGFCLLNLTREERELVIHGLALSLVEEWPELELSGSQSPGCGAETFLKQDEDPLRFFISGRPDPLRPSNGSAFESLILSFYPDQTQVCIDLGYAYG